MDPLADCSWASYSLQLVKQLQSLPQYYTEHTTYTTTLQSQSVSQLVRQAVCRLLSGLAFTSETEKSQPHDYYQYYYITIAEPTGNMYSIGESKGGCSLSLQLPYSYIQLARTLSQPSSRYIYYYSQLYILLLLVYQLFCCARVFSAWLLPSFICCWLAGWLQLKQ